MQDRVSRRTALAVAGTALIAGCTGEDTREPRPTTDSTDETVRRVVLHSDFEPVFVGATPPATEPENAPPVGDRVLPLPASPEELRDYAIDGGPPKDGIPSIDDPKFLSADAVDSLADSSVVFGIVVNDDIKAYPRRLLVHHEIVNDTLDETAVSVTYCPLTGTAQGFERGDTEFGVSGALINNNLVMYDRTLERWWPQIAASSIPGPWSDSDGGTVLRECNAIRTTWRRWRTAYPKTRILSDETGFARDYGVDPYGQLRYYESDGSLFENRYTSDRHHAKQWIYGVRTSEGAVAFLKETVRDNGTVDATVGDTSLLAVYDPALDTAHVYRNPEEKTFVYDDIVTDELGNGYRPDSLPLERMISVDAYWFAWVAFYPGTIVYE